MKLVFAIVLVAIVVCRAVGKCFIAKTVVESKEA